MLNEVIKNLRKENKMTQDQFANELNVVRQTVSKWEKGTSIPDADMIKLISQKFSISISDLLETDDKNYDMLDEITAINKELKVINEKYAKEKCKNRIKVRTISILSFLITLIYLIYQIGTRIFLSCRAKEIGIIGGADGPTAIFVSVKNNYIGIILVLLIFILSLIGIYKTSKKTKG